MLLVRLSDAFADVVWPTLAQQGPRIDTNMQGLPGSSPALEPQICMETHIPVQSLCEHHLLPFHGVAHVAYMPAASGRLPRALLEEIVSAYAHRLQVRCAASDGSV